MPNSLDSPHGLTVERTFDAIVIEAPRPGATGLSWQLPLATVWLLPLWFVALGTSPVAGLVTSVPFVGFLAWMGMRMFQVQTLRCDIRGISFEARWGPMSRTFSAPLHEFEDVRVIDNDFSEAGHLRIVTTGRSLSWAYGLDPAQHAWMRTAILETVANHATDPGTDNEVPSALRRMTDKATHRA